MLSPKGQQVMIPTLGQPKVHYGFGAVNDHTRETILLIRRRKRRREVARLLRTLLDKHPTETVFVAWDNFTAHQDDEVEEVVRSERYPISIELREESLYTDIGYHHQAVRFQSGFVQLG